MIEKKLSIFRLFLIILMCFVAGFAGYTIHKHIPQVEKLDFEKTTAAESTTQNTYQQPLLDITKDEQLAYYGGTNEDIADENFSEAKPEYISDPYNNPVSVAVTLTPENITWEDDSVINVNNFAFVKRYATSPHFKGSDPQRDTVEMTDYAYDNAFEPCKQAILEYIQKTHNSVKYKVTFQYEMTGDYAPKWIRIQAYSVEDKGYGINFSYHIFNYDKDRKVYHKEGMWAQLDSKTVTERGDTDG